MTSKAPLPQIVLRTKFGESNPTDVTATVSEKTFDYLMTTTVESIRVSSYLDQDWSRVESFYEELFVNTGCPSQYRITKIIPGSKTRWTITLPDAMKEGEQLTLQVTRIST